MPAALSGAKLPASKHQW